jgi:hypothetical protein
MNVADFDKIIIVDSKSRDDFELGVKRSDLFRIILSCNKNRLLRNLLSCVTDDNIHFIMKDCTCSLNEITITGLGDRFKLKDDVEPEEIAKEILKLVNGKTALVLLDYTLSNSDSIYFGRKKSKYVLTELKLEENANIYVIVYTEGEFLLSELKDIVSNRVEVVETCFGAPTTAEYELVDAINKLCSKGSK